MRYVIISVLMFLLIGCFSPEVKKNQKEKPRNEIVHHVTDFKVKNVQVNSNFSVPLLMYSSSFLNIEFVVENSIEKDRFIYIEVLLEPSEKSKKSLLIKSFGKTRLLRSKSFFLNWKSLNYLKGNYRLLFKVYLLKDKKIILKTLHYWGEYKSNYKEYLLEFI